MDKGLIGLIVWVSFVVFIITAACIMSWWDSKNKKDQKGQAKPVNYYGGSGEGIWQSVKNAFGFYDNKPPEQPVYDFEYPTDEANEDAINLAKYRKD